MMPALGGKGESIIAKPHPAIGAYRVSYPAWCVAYVLAGRCFQGQVA